jgi:exopolyphosphatase/guanosine-5'-triphosphate,3'-diphosphate pyrophosphatase
MRIASIDIGTNSALCLIADVEQRAVAALEDHATITRLGKGVDAERRLAPEAVERTLACLSRYADRIRHFEATEVRAVATSAMRDASDGDEFLKRAADILGARPEVISGQREAQLTFEGALCGLKDEHGVPSEGPVAVFDIGGGSTEIIVGARTAAGATIDASVSLDVGAVRLTERHLAADPPRAEQLEQARTEVRKALGAAPQAGGVPLVGVAGTVTTLAALAQQADSYDPARVHGSRLSHVEIGELLERLATMPTAARKRLAGLDPGRADVIVAGALVADEIARWATARSVTVSDRGVRWGLALAG